MAHGSCQVVSTHRIVSKISLRFQREIICGMRVCHLDPMDLSADLVLLLVQLCALSTDLSRSILRSKFLAVPLLDLIDHDDCIDAVDDSMAHVLGVSSVWRTILR